MPHPLKVEGTYNIRDLGGYPVADGGITNLHVFIRAGNLDQLPVSSQQQLLKDGVRTIVDLRDEWEVQQFPNVFAPSTTVQYVNLPLIGNELANSAAWQALTRDYHALHELYIQYVDHCQPQIRAIVATLAESTPTVILHCYAGKDRTGIIAALLLGAVGVPDDLIAEDYSQSYQEITHLVEQWRAFALEHGRDLERVERDAASEPTTMFNLLHHIKQNYGSVADYLRTCGVSDLQLAQLRSHWIQPSS